MTRILGLAALLAAVALIIRRIRDRRAKEREPGATSVNPIAVAQFDEIDAVVALRRCSCRGRFQLRGEGPVAGNGRVRQVRIECGECGREQVLFFDIAEALGKNGTM